MAAMRMQRREANSGVTVRAVMGVALGAACAVSCALLSGCGSTVAHRRERAMGPEVVSATPAEVTGSGSGSAAGSSWDVVLAPESASDGDLVWPGDGAYARRDAELAMRIEGPIDGVSSSWPQPDRPSLDQTQRLFLNRRAEDVVYFRREGERHRYRTRSW